MRPLSRDAVIAVVGVMLVGSCSSGGTTSTQTMSKSAGDGQTAAAGAAVAIRPAIKIVDQTGAAVSGISVTFAIASGGGSITGAATLTGADGIATVGSWTLGFTAGANTLTASAQGGVTGSPVTFTATASAANVATAMTKQGGDAQSATVGTAVAVAPSVKLVNASGAAVAGVAVAFTASTGGSVTGGTTTTNASGIATVGSWTVSATAGANTLTATATGSGITGNPTTFTATGTAPAFAPTGNISISGTQTFGSVNIPAGITVTLSADATFNISGPVTIAGTLTGDCVNLTITATGVLTLTGTINNGCTTAPTTTPSMILVATGGYSISGGTITLGGSLNLTNDATLTDATFPVAPSPGIRLGATGGAGSGQVGVCTVFGANFTANPLTAKAGTNGGQTGGTGSSGSTWTLQCTGELDITGATTVRGQNGGAGGTATDTRATGAFSTGGNGGKGGIIKVRANNGDLVISGIGNSVTSGDGGAGGAATATGTQVGAPGGSATTTGGNGNEPGNIVLQAKNGGVNINGALAMVVGAAGVGGAGTALAADGQAGCPTGAGGAATATGGLGGNTPDKTLTATGAVTGLGNVSVAGGAAGVGGAAKATSGTGGAGAKPCKPGDVGGVASATGGKGGNALLKNALSVLIANGGRGGSMEDIIAKGGQGWNDCVLPFESGGKGGSGGAAAGKNGDGGTGLQNGAPGDAKFTTVANGGNGGDGFGPGEGGPAGSPTANISVVAITTQPSFVPGLPGAWCAITKTVTFSLTTPATDDPAGHEIILQLIAFGPHTASISTTGQWTQLIPNNPVAFNCTFNSTTGIITCTQSGFQIQGTLTKTITLAVFTGTWNTTTQQLVGDLVLTIQGQVQTVKYHIVDP